MLATRGRILSVLAFVVAGGLGVISSTQPWVAVTLQAGQELFEVSGTSVLPTLAPLSLAALAMAGALAISGRFASYLIAAMGLSTSVWLLLQTFPLIANPPLRAVLSALTEKTGLAGEATLQELVARLDATAWSLVAFVLWLVLAAASVFVFVTAHLWRSGGRRYQTAPSHPTQRVDSVDSWDELSRGSDPTAAER